MAFIGQHLIKAVPVNMHLMFALNHTSKAYLFKPEATRVNVTKYSFWKSFLSFFWIYITHFPASAAVLNGRAGEASGAGNQSSGSCYSRKELRTHLTGPGLPLLSVYLHQPVVASLSKSRQRKAALSDRWHPGESFRAWNTYFFSCKSCS